MKYAELLLAVLYQRQLWPTVSLALDPAQNVSLLHRSPVTPFSCQQDPDSFLLNQRMTELHLCLILLNVRSEHNRDP